MTEAPATPLDVEVLLHDVLPKVDLERFMEFKEDETQLIIKIIQFLAREEFGKVHEFAVQYGGKYDGDGRQWLIPKPHKEKMPDKELHDLGFQRATTELTQPYNKMREVCGKMHLKPETIRRVVS